jgi:hypothetical protein
MGMNQAVCDGAGAVTIKATRTAPGSIRPGSAAGGPGDQGLEVEAVLPDPVDLLPGVAGRVVHRPDLQGKPSPTSAAISFSIQPGHYLVGR